MRPIGFSTGALAFDDFQYAMSIIVKKNITIVELSALREQELEPLIDALDSLKLNYFEYVSFHAPSRLVEFSESKLIGKLMAVAERRIPLIVHPDIIQDAKCWRVLGQMLCIENMDKRKAIGRNIVELSPFFEELPEASFCFDIGHARQVDPTMSCADEMLTRYRHKLRQVHISDVNASSKHEQINFGSSKAFEKVSYLIDENIPIVLETPASIEQMDIELNKACHSLPIGLVNADAA